MERSHTAKLTLSEPAFERPISIVVLGVKNQPAQWRVILLGIVLRVSIQLLPLRLEAASEGIFAQIPPVDRRVTPLPLLATRGHS
jgi:hypothetical protein